MRRVDLLDVLVDPDPGDWQMVPNRPDPSLSFAVLDSDAAVTLEWGREHNEGEPWDYSGLDPFIDPKALGVCVDLQYHGVVMHTELLMLVDGRHCYLPMGTLDRTPVGDVEMRATSRAVDIARLVDELEGGHFSLFDSYLQGSKIRVTKPLPLL